MSSRQSALILIDAALSPGLSRYSNRHRRGLKSLEAKHGTRASFHAATIDWANRNYGAVAKILVIQNLTGKRALPYGSGMRRKYFFLGASVNHFETASCHHTMRRWRGC